MANILRKAVVPDQWNLVMMMRHDVPDTLNDLDYYCRHSLYVNGADAIPSTWSSTVNEAYSNRTSDVVIAGRADGSGFFNGDIAHVAMWRFWLHNYKMRRIYQAVVNEGWLG